MLLVIETKVVIGWFKLQLWMWLVDLHVNYIFEYDWLIELSNNKLSNNKLSDSNLASELVENRSEFFTPITIKKIAWVFSTGLLWSMQICLWRQTRIRPMPLTSLVVEQMMARFCNFYSS